MTAVILMLCAHACAWAPPSGKRPSSVHVRRHRSFAMSDAPPNLKALAKFSVPLLGIGLASPLLSLVDTAVVGQFAGPLPLAALAPATATCDIAAYVATFLAPTTTNFVATALASGDAELERREVRNALFFATSLGLVCSSLMLAFCVPAIRLLSGADTVGGLLLADACAYTRWRALGMPAAYTFMVLQATFLGGQNWRPPTVAVLVAIVFNLILDLWLVAGRGMGVAGAAIATVAAQYGAAVTLAIIRGRRVAAADSEERVGADGTAVPSSTLPRGGASNVPDTLLPTRAEHAAWSRFGLPLAVGQAARCVTFAQMTAAATAGGAVAAAAHQVCVRLFYATLPFGDAVSTTAQAFLPAVADPEGKRLTRGRIRSLAIVTSLGTCALVATPLALPALTRAFTPDAAIRAEILRLLPFVGACSLCYPLASAAEGVLVAARNLRPIALLYALWPALIGTALRVYAPWVGSGTLLAWAAFATVHAVRLAVFVPRARRAFS